MGNSVVALIFVLTLNVLMMLSQISVDNLATAEGTAFYNCSNSLLESWGTKCTDASLNTNIVNNLPSSEGSVSPTSGNIFTDIFSNILSFFKKTPGLRQIYGVASAPYNILKVTGMPNEYVVVLGTFWYGISMFIIISYFWGRGND